MPLCKFNLSPIWHHRKSYPTHAQINIRNLSERLKSGSTGSVKMNNADVKEKWKEVKTGRENEKNKENY